MGETDLVNVDGNIVERDALNIAEKISETWPELRLQAMAAPADNVQEPPFRVIEMCRDGQWRLVLTAWTLDERILERIHALDTTKFDVLGDLEKKNAEIKKDNYRRFREQMDEARDLVLHIAKSHKDEYTARIDGKLVKFRA